LSFSGCQKIVETDAININVIVLDRRKKYS